MSADESFLTRWACRKRAGAAKARGEAQPKESEEGAAPEAAAGSLPPGEAQSLVDPGSLPPIETIGAGSDIRPFLTSGVPVDVTRAALRRAWSADPAIRDFVGLSENSWDFNAAGGVPGFGSLTMEDARRLLARVQGEPEGSDPHSQSGQPASGSAPDQVKLIPDSDADHRNPMSRGESSNIAMQHDGGERESSPSFPRRRHGGALPD
jgi:Protein of unknown function (DUF3306)